MICYYINNFTDNTYTYYDLVINDALGNLWMRLNGVIFNNEPNNDELINRCFSVINEIRETSTIEKIYLGNGNTCIYNNG